MKVLNRFGIDFDETKMYIVALVEELSKNAHTRSYFECIRSAFGSHSIGDTLSYREVSQEMLAEMFLCFNFIHRRKDTTKRQYVIDN